MGGDVHCGIIIDRGIPFVERQIDGSGGDNNTFGVHPYPYDNGVEGPKMPLTKCQADCLERAIADWNSHNLLRDNVLTTAIGR